MTGIRVKRTLHVEGASPQEWATVGGVAYVSPNRNVLMQSVTVGQHGMIRRSEDNGVTWRVVEECPLAEEPQEDGLVRVRWMPSFYGDSETGMAVRRFITYLNKPGLPPWKYAESPVRRTIRNYVQVSGDEGRTWSSPEQVIAQGAEYDAVHWAPGVEYGRNDGVLYISHMLRGRDGSLIATFDGARLFETGDIINPAIPPHMASPDGPVQWISRCVFGRWRDDFSGLDWSFSDPITLPLRYSCDGGDEPSIARLDDGRVLMVLRARTFPHTGQEIPSLKYYSLSNDDGWTWADPEPLLYDDGSYAYSPACMGVLFRASATKRIYLITNLADAPCVNVLPRNKLQIAQIDTRLTRIRKDSVTIIEQQDKAAGQSDEIHFSNFSCYEDRETKNLVLFMTACPGIPPDAYRYEIELTR